MTKPASFDMPPLNVSLGQTLGDYYQDFGPAIELVESGYHGGRDERGVPWITDGSSSRFYSAIIAAQYALANLSVSRHAEEGRARLARVLLDSLVENQETHGDWAGCWLMAFQNKKYRWLRPPWTSALASGNAISALLRGWERFGDERYRSAAELAYQGLHVARRSMSLYQDDGNELWYEEYPSTPPLRVLNGHIYALLGVADFARATGDREADDRWRRAAATAQAHLEDFDLGYWSAYDLLWREPAALHYQKNIHVPQLRILRELTGDPSFDAMADRWERQLRSVVSRARWQVEVRLHARRRRRMGVEPS